MTGPFVSIVGIGEDGVEGLSAAAREAVGGAAIVWGGARHLALAEPLVRGRMQRWPSPIEPALDAIAARAGTGETVCVLASGDPFCFGIGSAIARRLPRADWRCFPGVSSVSLASSALGWPSDTFSVLSLCGRPIERLDRALEASARLVVLSADETTPGALAARLVARGAGEAILHVMERLGGPGARIRSVRAASGPPDAIDRLNLVALELPARPEASGALAPGLPAESFEHDGQLTRTELRAIALASLAPRRGETLWDIGAGAGSIAIEWARCDPSLAAFAFERDPARGLRIGRNARALGVADAVRWVGGEAPESLAGRGESPDAIFVGGGGRAAVLDLAYARLAAGGRLVAHAVTVETEQALIEARHRYGGALTRIGLDRLDALGDFTAFRPAMTVTQWVVRKAPH